MLGKENTTQATNATKMPSNTPKPKQLSITSFFTPKSATTSSQPTSEPKSTQSIPSKRQEPEKTPSTVVDEPVEPVKKRRLVQKLDSDDDVEMLESTTSSQTVSTPKTPVINIKPKAPSRLSGFALSQSKTATPASTKKDETRYDWLVNVRDAELRTPDDPDYDPRTLFIPPSAFKAFTEFERQYWEIKSKHWDTVVFFKKGKFYELYEKDAYIGHQEFDLRIAERVNMSMAGVPESGVDAWIAKLLGRGYRVAVVDQMQTTVGKRMEEKNGTVKKGSIMKRELSSIHTNGTLTDPTLINSDMSTYCLAVKEEFKDGNITIGFVLLDASTGEFTISQFTDDETFTRLETMLTRTKPREILYPKAVTRAETLRVIRNAAGNASLGGVDYQSLNDESEFWTAEHTVKELGEMFDELPPLLQQAIDNKEQVLLSSVGAMMWYLKTLKLDKDLFLQRNFHRYDPDMADRSHLVLDSQTLRNLDVLENSFDGSLQGSLLEIMNRCTTPFGKRLFKRWLCHPLRSIVDINDRLDAIDGLCQVLGAISEMEATLRRLPDLERTVSRVHSGTCKPKDFVQALSCFGSIMALFKEVKPVVAPLKSKKLAEIFNGLPSNLAILLEDVSGFFDLERAEKDNAIVPNVEVDEEYATCVSRVEACQRDLQEYLKQIRKQVKCEGIQYRDIGKDKFQLELPVKIQPLPGWELKSKTVNVHRFHTKDLVKMIEALEEAQELELQAQESAKGRLYERFDENLTQWNQVIKIVAELDCLLSLCKLRVSLGEPCCRPEFVPAKDQAVFQVKGLRHPLHVCMGKGDTFIPNDTFMGGGDANMILLTGPNMGGKSTLLRQVGTCAIMAQMGSYVPALSLKMSPFDRIFTRIGAHDNILAGQSTFMLELSETGKILNEATSNSLVILDELGRGTSTFDGYSIAYSVLHDLVTRIGCLGLFTTHHTMLTQEFSKDPLIRRMYMSFESNDERREVTFLYKLTDGISPKSYGMNVASMAGIPHEIVDTAEKVSREFEQDQRRATEALQSSLGSSLQLTRLSDFCRLFGDLSMKPSQARLIHKNLANA